MICIFAQRRIKTNVRGSIRRRAPEVTRGIFRRPAVDTIAPRATGFRRGGTFPGSNARIPPPLPYPPAELFRARCTHGKGAAISPRGACLERGQRASLQDPFESRVYRVSPRSRSNRHWECHPFPPSSSASRHSAAHVDSTPIDIPLCPRANVRELTSKGTPRSSRNRSRLISPDGRTSGTLCTVIDNTTISWCYLVVKGDIFFCFLTTINSSNHRFEFMMYKLHFIYTCAL